MPQFITVNDTIACNLSCPHCKIHGNEKRDFDSEKMSSEAVISILNQSLPAARSLYMTVGGEPFFSKNLELFIEKSRASEVQVELTTNGTYVKEAILPALLSNCGSITFSADAAYPESFELLRRGGQLGSFLKNLALISGIIQEAQLKTKLCFSTVLLRSNIAELPQIIRMAKRFGVKVVRTIIGFIFFDHLYNEDLHLYKSLYNYYYRESRKLAAELDITLLLNPSFPGAEPIKDERSSRDLIVGPLANQEKTNIDYDSLYDSHAVKAKAKELAKLVVRYDPGAQTAPSHYAKDLFTRLSAELKSSLCLHRHEMEYFRSRARNKKIRYCFFPEEYLFFTPSTAFLCCMPNTPRLAFDLDNLSVGEIWLNPVFQKFRKDFFYGLPQQGCKDCCENSDISIGKLIDEVDARLSTVTLAP